MHKFYPEVYFPTELIKFNKNWKSVLEAKLQPKMPTQPLEPKEPEKPKFDFFSLISPPFVLGIFIYAIFKSIEVFLTLSIIWFAIYILNYLSNLLKYPGKIKIYKKSVNEYQLLLNQFNEKLELRKIEIQKLKELLNDINWSYKKRLEYTNTLLKPLKKAEIHFENTRIGRSEKQFEQILKEVFQKSIKTHQVVEVFSYYSPDYIYEDYEYDDTYKSKEDNSYICDFILEHINSNLTIDIEIDEPYSINNKPIHTYLCPHDEKRNKYFLELGWIVIRFSEEQIKNSPYSCCKEIATLILDLTGDAQYSDKLINYPRIYRHKKWTFEESKNFALSKTRNNIIPTFKTSNDLFSTIKNKWSRNGKTYDLTDANYIIEINASTSNTNKIMYKKFKTHDGRFILDVQSGQYKTKFIIEDCNDDIMIWTDIYSREYIDFNLLI